jgi:alkylation response protein AidB-like acyl-CoA dehydrogenase
MTTPLISRPDLDFLLYDWLRIERLFERPRFADHGREVVDALLDLSAQMAERAFLSHYKISDRVEPSLTEDGVRIAPEAAAAVRDYIAAGFPAGPLPAEVGGLQLPYVVHSASMAHFFAANVATAAYPMLSIANTNLLAQYATPAQVEAFLAPQLDGRALGTMCLSEPQAGSSLADIATRAEPDGEDALGRRYRLFGNKMWISGGDHDITPGITHLVLAKAPGPDGKIQPGTKGISLFVAPKRLADGSLNDIAVAGLNHKMGYRGTSNCLLNFGEGQRRPDGAAGAIAYLIGEPGQGLPIMFHMMNEARIAVGLGAAALGYRGYRLSLQYAHERLQGRAPDAKDPAAPPIPIIRHADVKLMLLAQKTYAEGALAVTLYCANLIDEAASADTDEARREAETLLGLLTPVAKTWPSEWGLAANDLAIQVHGGYGYTRDFDVEQLYRDNRLNPIHEGATGIQAIDLLGRKTLRDTSGAWALLDARLRATAERARQVDGPAEQAIALVAAWDSVTETVSILKMLNDTPRALWNATAFLRAFGHVLLAWLWLDQTLAAEALDPLAPSPLTVGKRHACRFMYEYELPKVSAWLAAARSATDVAAAMPENAF